LVGKVGLDVDDGEEALAGAVEEVLRRGGFACSGREREAGERERGGGEVV
jgi:hypothetical protein